MNAIDWGTLIKEVDFPIICTLGLAFFIYKVWVKMQEQQDKLTTTLVEVNTTNREVSETNKKLVESIVPKVECMEKNTEQIQNISKDVELIKHTLEIGPRGKQ